MTRLERNGTPMPTGAPVLSAVVTGVCVAACCILWAGKAVVLAANRGHMAWIDSQARIQALGVRLSDALDRMQLGELGDDDEEGIA